MAVTLKALIVDYGGVLTNPLAETIDPWLREEGVEAHQFGELMRGWLAAGAAGNIAHELETGRLDPREFERRLAGMLTRADGTAPDPDGLLSRMFAGFREDRTMSGVVRAARDAGLRTGLLSNSWGFDYSRRQWGDLFDAVVISGEVGMRKPDPEIYLHAAEKLGVPPAACVFVDDLRPNIRGAVRVGMVGVHHCDVDATIEELEALFEVRLR